MKTMIKLTGINKIYRTEEIETQALENVNLEVQKGEFLSIMGPSGCGKSTLLNIMGLLDSPTSGTIEINGTSTENMNDKELAAFRNKTLGFVFQSFHLINSLNVIDNVELPLLYRKMSSSERTALAKAVLERVGLSHRMKHMPTQLSGGQCQRVAIARAIVGNPEIILADEPTGNLDSKMGNIPYIQIVGVFRSGGDTTTGVLYDLSCLWGLSLPVTLLTAFVLKLPFVAVFAIMYISEDVIKSFLCLRHFRSTGWIRPVTPEGKAGLETWKANRIGKPESIS